MEQSVYPLFAFPSTKFTLVVPIVAPIILQDLSRSDRKWDEPSCGDFEESRGLRVIFSRAHTPSFFPRAGWRFRRCVINARDARRRSAFIDAPRASAARVRVCPRTFQTLLPRLTPTFHLFARRREFFTDSARSIASACVPLLTIVRQRDTTYWRGTANWYAVRD